MEIDMQYYDAVVIGAGLLGVFTARSLARFKLRVCVLEKAGDVCTGISKANAAIVYSGYDTPPNTLKSALCVSACEGFDKLCAELGVRFSRCGSLLVCFGPEGEKAVLEKYRQGLKNGIKDLRILNREEILQLEPAINPTVRMGLFAPNAGTVEPWELGIAAYENARDNGVEFIFESEVSQISRENDGFMLRTSKGEVFARCIINCAGLNADKLRETLEKPAIRIRYSLTDFAVFGNESKNIVKHVIFSECEDGRKGVTLIPTVDGKLMAEGPAKIKTDDSTPRNSDSGIAELYRQCRELIPKLDTDDIIRHFAAVRPNPYDIDAPKRQIDSFTMLDENGMISLIGIKTPGLTCAEKLGRLACDAAVKFLGKAEPNGDYAPYRTMQNRIKDMDCAERIKKISENPLYGKILCRCEEISEGEVLDAIHAGARTLGGVKRRCGAGFGVCQGSFCTARIAELLAAELKISVEEVLKRHA